MGSEGDPVQEKARRLGLVEVRCACGGTGILKRRSVQGPDGWVSGPCSCKGRRLWRLRRQPDGLWWDDETVMAQDEPTAPNR